MAFKDKETVKNKNGIETQGKKKGPLEKSEWGGPTEENEYLFFFMNSNNPQGALREPQKISGFGRLQCVKDKSWNQTNTDYNTSSAG